MVGQIGVNQKGMSQLDATLTNVPLILTFDLDLWPWISMVKFYLGNGGPDCHGTKGAGVDRMPWCETTRKWVNWTLRWLGPFNLDFRFSLIFIFCGIMVSLTKSRNSRQKRDRRSRSKVEARHNMSKVKVRSLIWRIFFSYFWIPLFVKQWNSAMRKINVFNDFSASVRFASSDIIRTLWILEISVVFLLLIISSVFILASDKRIMKLL